MDIAILFGTFIILLVIGVPISLALFGAGFMAFASCTNVPLIVTAQKLYGAVDSFTLAAIPFFLLAGAIMGSGGISRRMTDFANRLLGWLPGGLAVVTVFTCMLFGCLCGSPTATVAAIGAIMVPAMLEAGYDKKFTLALIAAAGMIGTIIPPSTMMITYSSATGASVGKLFMGGILPGVILGTLMILFCIFYGVKHGISRTSFSLKLLGESLFHAVGALLMPIIILGGIYTGIFTPTEAAAVACAYGLIVSIFFYKEMKISDLLDVFVNSSKTTGMVMFIVAAAGVFGVAMTRLGIASRSAEFIISIASNKYLFLLLVNIMLLIVGCFLEATAAMLILCPILMPAVTAFGISPVHFGIIVVLNLCVGLITPPLGTNLYVAAGLRSEKIETLINKNLLVLFFICLVNLLLVTYIPEISLILSRGMK